MAHIEANANSRKATDREVEIVAKAYEKELLEEINEQEQKMARSHLNH